VGNGRFGKILNAGYFLLKNWEFTVERTGTPETPVFERTVQHVPTGNVLLRKKYRYRCSGIQKSTLFYTVQIFITVQYKKLNIILANFASWRNGRCRTTHDHHGHLERRRR
jgi:hypothetical protein